MNNTNKNPPSYESGFCLAPPVGLEPTTPWLTVTYSTDWAKEEYLISLSGFCFAHFSIFTLYVPYSPFIRIQEVYVLSYSDFLYLLCWHWPIFPGRLQPSIFGTAELNFRVRNGNGWTLCVKITDCSFEFGAPSGTRTPDPLIKSQLLYQLS